MATRGHSMRRGTAPKRRLFWARRNFSTNLTDANQASTFNLLETFETAYGADLFGFTVTRIIGNISFYTTDTGTGAATLYTVSAGIRKDEQVEVVGSTEVDQQARIPANDPHVDWMWARNQAGVAAGLQTGDFQPPGEALALNRTEFDIHSQRRMDELGQSLYLFVGLTASPAVTVTVTWDSHVLCKRP